MPQETMADFEDAINASFRRIREGDLMTGTVIGGTETELLVDLGTYTEGVIFLEDASDDPDFTFRSMEPGQTVQTTVIQRKNTDGRIQLSMKEAAASLGWERLRELLKSQADVKVRISEAVKGGVIAYLEGIRGFIPASRLSLNYAEDLDSYVGKEIAVRVITAEESEKKLVLSAREILREQEEKEKAKKVAMVQIGLVTEGTVETLKPYGAFVNLGNGLCGLLPVSQICEKRIKHPGAVLEEGQTVKVKITEAKDGRISLSMKALKEEEPEEV